MVYIETTTVFASPVIWLNITSAILLRSQYPILQRTSSFGIKHVLAVDTIWVLCIFHVFRIYICVQSYIRLDMFLLWLQLVCPSYFCTSQLGSACTYMQLRECARARAILRQFPPKITMCCDLKSALIQKVVLKIFFGSYVIYIIYFLQLLKVFFGYKMFLRVV